MTHVTKRVLHECEVCGLNQVHVVHELSPAGSGAGEPRVPHSTIVERLDALEKQVNYLDKVVTGIRSAVA